MIFSLLASYLILTNNVNTNFIPAPSAYDLSLKASTSLPATRLDIREKVYQEALERFGSEEEAEAVLKVVNFESGFKPEAKNGRCYGLFQQLGYTNPDVRSQITSGINYIQERYQLPSKAWQHEEEYRWY